MDLVSRTQNVPSATKGYRDQNAALARDLAPIAQITGQPVAPKTLRGDYLALEVDRTHLVAVCRFLRDPGLSSPYLQMKSIRFEV